MIILVEAVNAVDRVWHIHTDTDKEAGQIKPGLVLHCEHDFARIKKILQKEHKITGVTLQVPSPTSPGLSGLPPPVMQQKRETCFYIEVDRGKRAPLEAGTQLLTTEYLINTAPPNIQQGRADEMVENACMNTITFVVEQLIKSPDYINILKTDGELSINSLRRSAFWKGVRRHLKGEIAKIQ